MSFLKIGGTITLWVFCSLFFYSVNGSNYKVEKEIQSLLVEHPEFIPNPRTVTYTSFGFSNLQADMYWLRTIQYIGGNAISSEYKKYLFVMLDLITELNPYFESPYTIGQLLLPSYNERYEDTTDEEVEKNLEEAIHLSLKGIQNFCDADMVTAIFNEDDLGKIETLEQYQNPCKSYTIPYYLAYIYYFYKNDGETASNYYKVVSAQDDAPEGAKVLAAIMQGKWGDREKSLYMFLSLAKSIETEETACTQMTQELENVYTYISQEKLPLTAELIQNIEITRSIIFPKLTDENELEILDDTKCSNYLIKAIREINLMYIETANAQFEADHPQGLPARNAKALFDEWYIDFLPTDYQQYEDYGIIYEYNYDIGRYDYAMGSY